MNYTGPTRLLSQVYGVAATTKQCLQADYLYLHHSDTIILVTKGVLSISSTVATAYFYSLGYLRPEHSDVD